MSNLTYRRNEISYWRSLRIRSFYFVVDLVLLLPLVTLAALSRLARRPVDIGLGPLPIVNSIHHKKCFQSYGYSCETYTDDVWHITTDFDVQFSRYARGSLRLLLPYVVYIFAIFRYRCLYLYFSGGPLRATTIMSRFEPLLYQIAGMRTVVMAFGMDVNELTRTPNKNFVAALARDYPWFRHERLRVAALIDAWTRGASYIIAGADWIDYLYFWDKLILSHFAIDTNAVRSEPADSASAPSPLKLIHAPNHRHAKGTPHIVAAVEELRSEGVAIELRILERVPNEEVHRAIREADVVVDQIVIGWYAMFAIEGMALGKPVICYLRDDLVDFYAAQGLVSREDIPILSASHESIKDVLRRLASTDRRELVKFGMKSRSFVEQFHSIEKVGQIFDEVNRTLGVLPRGN